MLTDTAGYSAAALLQTWSLVNSASVLLSPNARETLSPVDLSADQWTELADAYAEMLRDGRSHDFAEGILGAVTASGRTDEYPGLNVFCAPPMEGESGTYLCALQVWERRAKPKRDGTDIKPSNEDIARGFADRLLLKLSDKRTALLRLGNDLELSVGGLGPDPLKQVLGAK